MKAIRRSGARADRFGTAAARLRVYPAPLRDDLLEFLRASSCLGVRHGADEIEVYLLNSVSDRHDRAVVAGCVEALKAAHAEAAVEIISG